LKRLHRLLHFLLGTVLVGLAAAFVILPVVVCAAAEQHTPEPPKAAGQPLDGSNGKYTLTFPPSQLPPVNAFWSITMYDGKTELLIKNPINRYLINSPMLPNLKKNDHGSLRIYIQKDSPGADKESNWLPAPDSPIYMAMRLYWPKTEPPSTCRLARAPGSHRG
jgi:hypothetical protein